MGHLGPSILRYDLKHVHFKVNKIAIDIVVVVVATAVVVVTIITVIVVSIIGV